MRFLLILAAVPCLMPNFSAPALFAQPEATPLAEREEQAFQRAVAFVEPSVVRIQTVGGLDRVGGILANTGPTTGVVVSENGYILSSAFNFVSKPSSILVEFPDGRRLPAREIATDRLRMLTLLKIDAQNLTPAVAAESDSARVGQWAIAVGRTYSPEKPSMSVGIVSALNRIWGKAIQTDAKVSPVNYGGPLVDLEGRIMGILVPLSVQQVEVTAGVEWYDSGIGFAIPMSDAYEVVERLKQGVDLKTGLMGVSIARDDLTEGDLVLDMVRPDSPAYRAGIRPKDVLVSVNGMELRRLGHLKYALGTSYAGDTVRVEFKRKDEMFQEELVLVDRLIPYEAGFLGILPARPPATDQPAGIEIRYVHEDGPAEQAGLKKRDRIVKFQGEDVGDSESLRRLIARERPGNKVVVVYRRGEVETPVEIELDAVPDELPFELTDSFIPPPADHDAVQQESPTGRIEVEMEAHNHAYWGYVPEDYNPDYQYGLVVWIHPGGETREAETRNDWRTFCETRGMILIGPKAEKINGWNLNEAEFIKDAVADVSGRYNIDPARVVLHSYGNSGPFAYHLAFKYRDVFRGLAIVGAGLAQPVPENDPEFPLGILLVCGTEDEQFGRVKASADGLKARKYPVTFLELEGKGSEYPKFGTLDQIAIWADMLDQF
jgi:serine protease Do